MVTAPGRPILILLAVLFVVLACVPLFAETYLLKLVTRIMVLAIFAISLDLLIGYTGLVSFGHAAFFGLAAYCLHLLSPEYEAANLLWVLPACLAIAGAAGLVIGALVARTRGFYFIMSTLAFAQMLFFFFHDSDLAGGSDGAFIFVKPVLALGGATLIDLEDRQSFFYVCLACLTLSYLALVYLVRSSFGRAIQGVKLNEQRMRALGYDAYRYRLASFTVGATLAGLAGFLFAGIDGFVAPELLGWQESGVAIMIVILGGVGTLFGPILGAFAYAGVEEVLKDASLVGPLAEHWLIPMGLFVIAVVLLTPNGIAGLLLQWTHPAPAAPVDSEPAAEAVEEPYRTAPCAPAQQPFVPGRRSGEVVLEAQGLTKTFGGLHAVENLDIAFAHGRVHAIIGPNGAGKTTLINLLSGDLLPSAGRITLSGQDVTALRAHRVARLGLGRSYQKTNVIGPFTCRQNCWLAAQIRHAAPSNLLRPADSLAKVAAEVEDALAFAGLRHHADTPAADMSYGEQRQLEIAMILATGAQVLLLDEPMAGMSHQESERVVALIKQLSRDRTVILIEHDMDAVFAVADELTVMVNGRVLESGTPKQIRASQAVREAYLGDELLEETA